MFKVKNDETQSKSNLKKNTEALIEISKVLEQLDLAKKLIEAQELNIRLLEDNDAYQKCIIEEQEKDIVRVRYQNKKNKKKIQELKGGI